MDYLTHNRLDPITGNAAILGLQKDFNLTAAEYNWLGTIFYGPSLHLKFSAWFDVLIEELD